MRTCEKSRRETNLADLMDVEVVAGFSIQSPPRAQEAGVPVRIIRSAGR